MKNSLLLLFAFTVHFSWSQVNYSNSFEEAMELAKKENKLVMVKYYGETCSHCLALQKFLEQENIAKAYTEKFTFFKINAEDLTEKDHAFIKTYKFNIEQIPYLFFFKSDGEFVHFAMPNENEASILKVVETVSKPEDWTSNYSVKYKNGARDLLTLKWYSKLAKLQDDDAMIFQLGEDIFENTPENELMTKEGIITLAKYINAIKSKYFTYYIDNFEKLETLIPEFRMDQKLKVLHDILIKDINKFKGTWTLEELLLARSYVEKTNLSPNSYTFTWSDEMKALAKNKQEEEAIRIAELMMANSDFLNKAYVIQFSIETLNDSKSIAELQKKVKTLLSEAISLSEKERAKEVEKLLKNKK